VMAMVPVQIAPAAMPDGLTETVKEVPLVVAVKLPAGEMLDQSLLAQLCFDTCAVALVFGCAVTVRICGAGATPPGTALKVNDEGLTVGPPEVAATFSVTVAVSVTEAAVMEIVPLHVVPAVRPVGLTRS